MMRLRWSVVISGQRTAKQSPGSYIWSVVQASPHTSSIHTYKLLKSVGRADSIIKVFIKCIDSVNRYIRVLRDIPDHSNLMKFERGLVLVQLLNAETYLRLQLVQYAVTILSFLIRKCLPGTHRVRKRKGKTSEQI